MNNGCFCIFKLRADKMRDYLCDEWDEEGTKII